MNTLQKTIILAFVVLLSLSGAGCARTSIQAYLKPGLTVQNVKSIAVLPFDNISGHPDAGKKVLNLLLTGLIHTELFEIKEMGEVEKSLRDLRIRTTEEIDSSKLQKLGEQLSIRAIIVGSIDEYELRQDRKGTIPVVSISARILDVQTGDILWAASHIHDGRDRETIFGFGRIISLSRLAQLVVSEMTKSLVKELQFHSNNNITKVEESQS